MENTNRDSRFLIGLIIGIIIGAAVVFLVGTKKGKKILKAISEEKLNNLSDLLEQEEGEEYEEVDNDIEREDKEINKIATSVPVNEEKKPLVRRFFRRISKK